MNSASQVNLFKVDGNAVADSFEKHPYMGGDYDHSTPRMINKIVHDDLFKKDPITYMDNLYRKNYDEEMYEPSQRFFVHRDPEGRIEDGCCSIMKKHKGYAMYEVGKRIMELEEYVPNFIHWLKENPDFVFSESKMDKTLLKMVKKSFNKRVSSDVFLKDLTALKNILLGKVRIIGQKKNDYSPAGSLAFYIQNIINCSEPDSIDELVDRKVEQALKGVLSGYFDLTYNSHYGLAEFFPEDYPPITNELEQGCYSEEE